LAHVPAAHHQANGMLRRNELTASPPPVPRSAPQGTPVALPYPILRRLSSPSQRCVAPRYALLRPLQRTAAAR